MKYKWLVIAAAALLPMAVMAAEGLPGATVKPDGTSLPAKERTARMEACKANPEKCRAERTAAMDKRFKSADADGNGMISRTEADKTMPRLARHFERIDANKDGQVSREEMAAARKAHFEQRGRNKPDHGVEPSKI